MIFFVYTFLLIFCILVLGSIGGMFSERTGVVNIGINGMMIAGAVSYVCIGHFLGAKPSMYNQLWLIPLCGVIGGLFSCLHAFSCVKLKADHTISGFALNMLAYGIALMAILTIGHGAKTVSVFVPELALSSSRFEYQNILSFRLVLTIFIVIVAFIAIRYTSWGLRLRSVGENPHAADVAGINVNFYKWQGVIISGVLSGIAGAFFGQDAGLSYTGDVAGLGYLSLAIMIMGQWRIQWITLSALLFSVLYSLSTSLPLIDARTFGQYSDLLFISPYVIGLIVMIATSRRSAAPAADGIPYDKSKR